MKTFATIFCCLVFAAALWAASGPLSPAVRGESGGGALDQTWGPDPYGYIARDSQEPNGPTFNWLDISTTGTLVNGLGDDNYSNVLPIGFSFHYYWYDVTQFWVGSNGYIQFRSGGLLGSPFDSIPRPAAPNDVVGPWIADWILGGAEPGHCYYETRGADSLIVMWKSIRAWQPTTPTGNHNFEVILSRADSSITFQYGTTTTGDILNGYQVVGIENVTGRLGIQNYYNTYPTANRAIKFYYPANTTYVANDYGIAGVQNSISGGFFLLTGDTLHPWLSVQNVGNQTEPGVYGFYSVRNSGNTLLARDSLLMGSMTPAQVTTLVYPPQWVAPPTAAVYRITGRVDLSTDINHTNDSVRVPLHTVHLPAELRYDDNSSESAWTWSGGQGGMGNEFIPPTYPVRITQLNFYIPTFSLGVGFTAQIVRDSAGIPGSVLWTTAVNSPSAGAWNPVTVTDTVRIDSGGFFVAWMQRDSLITFGVDTTAGEGSARRTWEYSSSWAQYRNGQVWNAMIRATIAGYTVNHAPTITAHTPATLDTALLNSTHGFSVTASDPDGDSLRYRWTRGATQVATVPTVNISFPNAGPVVVKCVVSDGQLADSVMWNVFVATPSSAGDPQATLPQTFALHAAYPNPFNPSTSLAYDVAKEGEVTLKIFDLLGNETATLVNTRLAAGRYTVQWNASAMPSGTYFAVLTAKDVRLIQKLLLMK